MAAVSTGEASRPAHLTRVIAMLRIEGALRQFGQLETSLIRSLTKQLQQLRLDQSKIHTEPRSQLGAALLQVVGGIVKIAREVASYPFRLFTTQLLQLDRFLLRPSDRLSQGTIQSLTTDAFKHSAVATGKVTVGMGVGSLLLAHCDPLATV